MQIRQTNRKHVVSKLAITMKILTKSHSVFTIPSAIKCADGSNVPFAVPSTITFDDLRQMVAEKLRRFPGLLRLRYRLDSDKPKAGATSIQSDEELDLFKE